MKSVYELFSFVCIGNSNLFYYKQRKLRWLNERVELDTKEENNSNIQTSDVTHHGFLGFFSNFFPISAREVVDSAFHE